ncbi:hypothetical protein Riv7116_2377 [Rivularia sp. PCC 7116]|uniref:hypothetical protein n=1 Tax=Rivularia sp. PCC 7116 TaxID=373994 RepID=UPI00029F4030|nr:hypothetical protein [Rivularia sp. PCC 7116]AFY54893.1 hypothetical protein Riv7116_2377 [Rivularia sp. PCC 7116]
MKSNLKVLLLSLGLLLSSISTISAVTAQTSDRASAKNSLSFKQYELITASAKQVKNKELKAFFGSQYDYWDARVLANYWGQSVEEAKARIGRKIIWGKSDVAILEQFLVDARIQALQKMQSPNPSLELYSDSKYKYDDAQKLAAVWGDSSPWDAKIRIEKNLILGQPEVIEQALGK